MTLAILTVKQRKNKSKMHYLLPEKNMFPAPDVKHARLAYDLAKESLDEGDITKDEYKLVQERAKRRLKELGEPMGKSERDYYLSDRYAYKTNEKEPIYIPVNRIETPYQTDHALDEDKVK